MLLTVTVKLYSLPLLPEQDTHKKEKWQKKDLLHAREPEQKKKRIGKAFSSFTSWGGNMG